MPSVQQIRRSLGVPDVITISADGAATVAPPSELDNAIAFGESTFAQRVMRTRERSAEAAAKAEEATAELDAEEAHLKTEETRYRIREIRTHMRDNGGEGGGGGLSQIMAMLHEDRQQSQAQQAEAQGELMRMLQDQVKDLREQSVARLTESTNGHGPTLADQVMEAKNLLDTIRSLAPQPATVDGLAGMGRTVEEAMRLFEAKEAHEDRMADRKEAHEERMTRLRLERERFEEEKVERRERVDEDKRRGASLSNTLERALPYAQQFVQDAGSRFLGGGGGGSQPAASSPAASDSTPSYGPGTRIASCPQCKVLIPFPMGQEIGRCPGCGMVCTIQLDEPETPAAPGGGGSPVEPPASAPPAAGAPMREPEEMEAEEAVHAV